MSSVRAELIGENQVLLAKLRKLGNIQLRGLMTSIAEGLRTSTVERFGTGTSPDGERWQPSLREKEGGKTLVDTAALRNSIHSQVGSDGLAVGTNDIRAATHQFGDTRTIRAKNSQFLMFYTGGSWVRVKAVTVTIPERPFLGISAEDASDIKEQIMEVLEE